MTTEQIRIVLAELMGIAPPEKPEGSYDEKLMRRTWIQVCLPQLTLDWVHEIEKTLIDDGKWRYYYGKLWKVAGLSRGEGSRKLICATALQRAEALIRTLAPERWTE